MSPRLRHQLPAFSPIPAAAIVGAINGRVAHSRTEIAQAGALLRDYFSAEDVVLVDSGRSALQLAIRTAFADAGGINHVALPAYSCFEVATAAVGANARISLYDVDPLTLAPNLESLDDALRAGARTVVVAPLYAMPLDWEAVASLAAKYGAILIEDAAQSHGAQWRGSRLGSLGELSVVSFGRGKGWTGGGGGALLSRGRSGRAPIAIANEIEATATSREVKLLAAALVQWLIGRPSVYGIPASIPSLELGETHYHEPGPIAGIAPLSTALLRRTLNAARDEVERRRATTRRWMADMPDAARTAVPSVVHGGEAGFMRLPILIPEAHGTTARTEAARRAGMVASYPQPLGDLPALRERLIDRNRRYEGADRLAREVVTLPTHSRLAERDRSTILEILRAVFD